MLTHHSTLEPNRRRCQDSSLNHNSAAAAEHLLWPKNLGLASTSASSHRRNSLTNYLQQTNAAISAFPTATIKHRHRDFPLATASSRTTMAVSGTRNHHDATNESILAGPLNSHSDSAVDGQTLAKIPKFDEKHDDGDSATTTNSNHKWSFFESHFHPRLYVAQDSHQHNHQHYHDESNLLQVHQRESFHQHHCLNPPSHHHSSSLYIKAETAAAAAPATKEHTKLVDACKASHPPSVRFAMPPPESHRRPGFVLHSSQSSLAKLRQDDQGEDRPARVLPVRSRSRSIPIVGNKGYETRYGDGHHQDQDDEVPDEDWSSLYDHATWRMYNRIVDHREQQQRKQLEDRHSSNDDGNYDYLYDGPSTPMVEGSDDTENEIYPRASRNNNNHHHHRHHDQSRPKFLLVDPSTLDGHGCYSYHHNHVEYNSSSSSISCSTTATSTTTTSSSSSSMGEDHEDYDIVVVDYESDAIFELEF